MVIVVFGYNSGPSYPKKYSARIAPVGCGWLSVQIKSRAGNDLEPLAEVERALLVVEVLHLPHPKLLGLLRGGEHPAQARTRWGQWPCRIKLFVCPCPPPRSAPQDTANAPSTSGALSTPQSSPAPRNATPAHAARNTHGRWHLGSCITAVNTSARVRLGRERALERACCMPHSPV